MRHANSHEWNLHQSQKNTDDGNTAAAEDTGGHSMAKIRLVKKVNHCGNCSGSRFKVRSQGQVVVNRGRLPSSYLSTDVMQLVQNAVKPYLSHIHHNCAPAIGRYGGDIMRNH